MPKGVSLMIMSGPDDGAVFPLEGDQVLIGPSPEAQAPIKYDPNVSPQGIRAYLKEKEVVFEDLASGEKESRGFGELYLVGQTWVAVHQEEKEEKKK